MPLTSCYGTFRRLGLSIPVPPILLHLLNSTSSPRVCQVRLAKHVAVGCMNDVVHAYTPTGHKSWSLYLPCHILAMQRMEVRPGSQRDKSGRCSGCAAIWLTHTRGGG